MPTIQKRKASPEMNEEVGSTVAAKRQQTRSPADDSSGHDKHSSEDTINDLALNRDESGQSPQPREPPPADHDPSQMPHKDRFAEQKARFAALQNRQLESRKSNRREAGLESQRQSINPATINSLNRKRADAEQKLQRADAEAAGEDYERKRAWDWTVAESEAWDRRLAKKGRNRDDVAFQNYGQDARKVYKRQLREIGKPDMGEYEGEKTQRVMDAADKGELELVENEQGEIMAVDRDGTWFGGRESLNVFGGSRPEKEKIDRLVAELKKAEEVRLRKMRQRKGGEEQDVTYINEKNKQFNDKLARFYNKYTSDIRESFERGTAL